MKWLRHGWVAPALAAALFAVTLTFGFAYDDVHIIQQRQLLHTLGNWQEILTTPWWSDALYRPLTLLTFAVDWAVGGARPWLFHLVNVLLHAAVTYGVWRLARPAGAVTAGVAAFLFAVHPVHVEAVANIVGRAELLATLAAVVAVLSIRAGGRASGIAALASLVTGLGAKETAFAIPGLLIITVWASAQVAGVSVRAYAQPYLRVLLAAVLLAAAWMVLRATLLGDVAGDRPAPGLEALGLFERAVAMSPVVVHWVRLFLWPAALSPDYAPNHLTVVPEVTAMGGLGLVLLAAAGWWAWRERYRDPWITYALLWMAGTLVVVSNVLVPSGVLLAERSLYLPSVGLVLLLGRLAQRAHEAVPATRRWMVGAGVAVVVTLGAVRAAYRLPVWRDTPSVLQAVVDDAPASFRAWWSVGSWQWSQGETIAAERAFRRAIVIYPLWVGLWLDFGLWLERDQRFRDAAGAYHVALRLDSTMAGAAAKAIVNYLRAELPDSARAVAVSARSVALDYRVKIALSDLAMADERPADALTLRLDVARQFPSTWQYWYLALDAAIATGNCATMLDVASRLEAFPAADGPAVSRLREARRNCTGG